MRVACWLISQLFVSLAISQFDWFFLQKAQGKLLVSHFSIYYTSQSSRMTIDISLNDELKHKKSTEMIEEKKNCLPSNPVWNEARQDKQNISDISMI